MFGILLSAFNVVLAWVVRSLLVKFVVFFALYFITSEFVGFIAALIPNGSTINGALSGIGASTWYFLDVFMVPQGLSAVVSAYATRFIIRRIPVIGYKLTIKSRVSVENKRYDDEIFPLYSSYTGGTGKELQVDSRQNVLASKKLWILAAGVLLMGAFSLYTVFGFFNGKRLKADPQSATQADHRPSPGSSVTAAATGQVTPRQPSTPAVSDAWRAVGTVQAGTQHLVVLVGSSGRLRFEHPSVFQNSGALLVGEVDGQRVTTWTGASPPSTALIGSNK